MRLRTLGGLALEGAGGGGRLKPLLVVAYLALEGRQPRGHLAELCWPEGTDPRNRLSVTLRRLRSEAPGVVDADDTHVWSDVSCDAVALGDAIARGDVAAVVELYRGAFLEGLDLPLGVELEEWLYATREHLADRTRDALVEHALAAAGHGDFERAALLAERAADVRGATPPAAELAAAVADLLTAGASDHGARWRRRLAAEGVALPAADVAAARGRLAGDDPGSLSDPSLPRPSTTFVGRDRELGGVAELLERLDARLVTIRGAGGTGKSRLALEFAHRWSRRPGVAAVRHVSLSAVATMADVPGLVAAALGVRVPPGADAGSAVAAALAGREALVVLDEAEHLVEDARVLGELVAACRGLRLLVTSRLRLELEEEYVWELDGLSLPSGGEGSADLDTALASDAVRLFVHRARRARADLALDDADAPAIVRICRLVEGTPLAIELAAVWVRTLAPAAIGDHIQASLDALASPSRNIPAGHRTMRAVFDRSWSLLPEDATTALMRLAVCRDGFGVALARAVADAHAPALDRLVDASMLERRGGGRFRQHTLLHGYCRERLGADGALAADAERRHLAAMAALAADAEPHLQGADQGRWFDLLEADHGNLRAALVHAGRHDPSAGLRLAHRLLRFWTVRDHLREIAPLVRALLDHRDAAAPTADRARGLHLLACTPPYGAESRTANDACRAIAEAIGAGALVADAVHQAGRLASEAGDPAAAELALRDALGRYRALGDAHGEASTLNHLGTEAYFAGDHDAAERWYELSLELETRLGNVWGVASRHYNLGIIAKRTDRHDLARERYRRSLALHHELGDRIWSAYVIEGLACLASAEGDPRRAATLWGGVDAERRRTGRHRHGAELAEHERDVAEARRQAEPATFDAAWERGRREGLDALVERELRADGAMAA